MKRRALLVAVPCAAAAQVAPAAPALQVAMIRGDPEAWVAARLLEQVYRCAGFTARLLPLPAARAALEADGGRLDADLARTQLFGQSHAQLLRVPTRLYGASIVAAWLPQRKLAITQTQDLAAHALGALRGLHYVTEIVGKHPRLSLAQSTEQLFNLLQAGHVEAVLESRFTLEMARRDAGMGPLAYSEPLRVLDLFHYLHARHADKLPRIDQCLQLLTASGELQRMTRDYEAQAQRLPASAFR